MKHDFLLDENVLLRPAKAFDKAAVELWLAIFRNCHRIVLSPEYADRLWKWLRNVRSELARHPVPAFERTVRTFLTHKGKTRWVTSEAVQEEQYVRDPEDKFLARIAVHSPGCVFVSTDRDTRSDFQRPEFSRQYGVKALTIEEALTLAKKRY